MLTIKGFVENSSLANNEESAIATFGELSTFSRTFAKDIGIYTDQVAPALTLNVFSHKLSNVKNGVVLLDHVKRILTVVKAVYDKASSIDANTPRADYIADLTHDLHAQADAISVGRFVTLGALTVPEWISFKMSIADDNAVKIWLSNLAFERDWDEYEITVVPPLANVDTLFRPLAEIRASLSARTITEQMDQVRTLRGKHPETDLVAETVTYVNPQDNTVTYPITWYLLIYGPQGSNSEAIKRAIIDYIMANSREPESSWKTILPFLFKNTVMYILPRWEKLAIPNRQATVGIYSPITSLTEDLTYIKTSLAHLTTRFVEENAQVTHHKWRSITLLTCGGQDNAQDKFKLTDYIPDYIGEATSSLDFARMSAASREWTVAIEEMLIIAEAIDSAGALPLHTRRVTVGSVDYIARKIGPVEYHVALKEQP